MIRLPWNSLRMRLLAGTSLAIAVVLTLLGVAVYLSVKHALFSQLESELRVKANALAAMTEQTRHGIKFDADLEQMPEFSTSKRPQYFQLRTASGQVIARSTSLGKTDLPLSPPDDSIHELKLPDGRHGRSLTIQFTPASEREDEDEGASATSPHAVAQITVARDTLEVHSALEMLHGLLVGLCAGAIVASGTTLLLVVHFGLRPVVRVSDQIAALSETELSSRITETGLPAELRPMVERLNGLLQRLAAAFERERAFTADVAHELRTPLSALLTTLDVCRSRPRTSAEYEASLDKSRDLTQRLKSMVQNLLTMARAEAGQLTRSHTSVELCQLLHECWSPFQERAEMRKLQVQWTKPTACPIETDSDKLRIVLTNLLDNAVSYANDDGTITVAILQRAQGPVEIEVANTGNQIPAENMPQVFERFWRSDSSRSETGVHCGLGLSLCLRLSKVMGIGLQAETRPPDWFVVSLSIPGGDHNFGK